MGERLSAWVERWRDQARSLDFTLARRFGLTTREDRIFYSLIALMGVVAGLLGVAIYALTDALQALLWRSPAGLLEAVRGVPRWQVVAVPAVGGAAIGLMVWLFRGSVGGGGMAAMIESVALSGGRIAPRPVIVNALAAVVTVGSGGSLGREGPMVRLGAMVSSWLGSRFGLPPHRLKILVGCGAAAGLAAAYNIPIGGALFAMEVILGNFALEIFGPIVVSSVISTLLARAITGNTPHYAAPGYTLTSGWELLLYAGLGIVGGIASVLFVQGVRWSRRLFKGMTWVPGPLKPLLGMTLVGVLALFVPNVLGNGQETINLALTGRIHLPGDWAVPPWLVIVLLLGLAVAKLVATAITTSSGGAGGLFTPSLFVGAIVGAAYGSWVHSFWPLGSTYGAYAAVGMAAIAAGTSHAPISAILILFEFTGNYNLILPLMLAAILASVVSRAFLPYSIYTESLKGRGVDLPFRMEEAVLAGLKAGDLSRPDPETLSPSTPYAEVVERFLATRRQRLYVVAEDSQLLGAVSLHDIKHVLDHPETVAGVVAHDLMSPVDRTVASGERLHRAVEYFAHSDFERLPVVDEAGRFLGVIAKRDLLAVYAQEVLGRPAMLATFVSSHESQASRQYVEIPPDFALRKVSVPPELVGSTLAEARLPQSLGVRVIEIRRPARRGEEQIIPTADTRLAAGDLLVLLGPRTTVDPLSEGKLATVPGEEAP